MLTTCGTSSTRHPEPRAESRDSGRTIVFGRICFGLLALVISGCAAETRTIYFLPVDMEQIAPRGEGLAGVAEVRVADQREIRTNYVVRGSGKETELALYPEISAMVQELITTAADSILATDAATPSKIALECDITRFDVLTEPTAGRQKVIVNVEVNLRVDERQWQINGSRSQEVDGALARVHFQDVIHLALGDVAQGVRMAMTELAEGRET